MIDWLTFLQALSNMSSGHQAQKLIFDTPLRFCSYPSFRIFNCHAITTPSQCYSKVTVTLKQQQNKIQCKLWTKQNAH